MDELWGACGEDWAPLAAVCFLLAFGADAAARDAGGRTPMDFCQRAHLPHDVCAHFGKLMYTRERETGDAAEECLFGQCDDQPATVRFLPCGHRIICGDCLRAVPTRRCIRCKTPIHRRVDIEGNDIELSYTQGQPGDAAATDIENHPMVQDLKKKMDELENQFMCSICLARNCRVVFQCGHTCCSECANSLRRCHICRAAITKRQSIFANWS